jgi:hypothetical protein
VTTVVAVVVAAVSVSAAVMKEKDLHVKIVNLWEVDLLSV